MRGDRRGSGLVGVVGVVGSGVIPPGQHTGVERLHANSDLACR